MTREGKRRSPIGPGTEVQVLDQALNETARRLRQAYGAFDLVTDPDLVEAWIFEISAQRARYSYLLKQRKRLEQASDEAAQGGAAAD